MEPRQIEAYLRHPEAFVINTEPEVTSTNTLLKEQARAGAPAGTVLIADRQTGGRGSRGRSFFSPHGGLYLSVLLRPETPAAQAVGITVAAAVAGLRAVRDVWGIDAAVKWVNDLYLNGRKVAGILTEAEPDPETNALRWAVVGIGFNVTPPEGGFPPELQTVAGALRKTAEPEERAKLAAAFLDRLYEALRAPKGSVVEEYRAHSYLTGRRVMSLNGAFPGSALVLGVDDDARLLVRTDDGAAAALSSGEVRLAPDAEG